MYPLLLLVHVHDKQSDAFYSFEKLNHRNAFKFKCHHKKFYFIFHFFFFFYLFMESEIWQRLSFIDFT